MRLLLDTHALIWWMLNGAPLTRAAREAIADPANEIFVSAVSAFEITTKVRVGKLAEVAMLSTNFEHDVAEAGFATMPITVSQAHLAGRLRIAHKDPFDRMLIAQGILERLILVSNERAFDAFGVSRLW